tara:strand:- start:209 stop:430 length:222 start_codon:yes stop_codon:yes gene_type:complete
LVCHGYTQDRYIFSLLGKAELFLSQGHRKFLDYPSMITQEMPKAEEVELQRSQKSRKQSRWDDGDENDLDQNP